MMTPIEIIAAILIFVSLIKIFVLLVSPKSWMGFAKIVWSNAWATLVVFLCLAGVVFYYLVQELTIVQILAATAFMALFMGVGLASHAKELITAYEKQIKNHTLWKANGTWLYVLLWLVLLGWGLKELFF